MREEQGQETHASPGSFARNGPPYSGITRFAPITGASRHPRQRNILLTILFSMRVMEGAPLFSIVEMLYGVCVTMTMCINHVPLKHS